MTKDSKSGPVEIADRAVAVSYAPPRPVGQGFRTYERYDVTMTRAGEPPLTQERDVLRAGRSVNVLPIDVARQQVVLIRQFRLTAHLATGKGEMVEIVAGWRDPGETVEASARRECQEEIGVTPQRLVEIISVMPTPGITDEYTTMFAGFVDASQVPARSGSSHESEDTRPFVVSIDEALAALTGGRVANAYLVMALQWLALNRDRLPEFEGV